MLLYTKAMQSKDIYKVMSQSIIPRPIAWTLTQDEGIVNIAPFSYFIPLASNPPSVLISVGHKSDGTPKDTLYNLRKHKCCTICIATPPHLDRLHQSAQPLAHEKSEVEAFGIETYSILQAFPPIVKDVPVALFCSLVQEIDLGGPTVPLILKIEAMHIDDEVVADKDGLVIEFEPLARIGKSYAKCSESLQPRED